MDRCHRIGQQRPVLVLRLATAHSVEGKMLKRASEKMALERLVIKKGVFKEVVDQVRGGGAAGWVRCRPALGRKLWTVGACLPTPPPGRGSLAPPELPPPPTHAPNSLNPTPRPQPTPPTPRQTLPTRRAAAPAAA
jgi:hypothetical protein